MKELKNFSVMMADSTEGMLTIASGPVIIENGKTVLVQHGDGEMWKFPGGTVRTDESFEQTAIREVKEEIGAEVELIGEPHIVVLNREKDGKKITVVLAHYFAKRLNEVIIKGEGIDKVEWFDINQLPENCQPNVIPVIKHFQG